MKIKKNLFLKTDVLPEEMPILFSNSHLYYFFTSERTKEYFVSNNINESIPYNYTIPKTDTTQRDIGLLHPIAQLQTFFYIFSFVKLSLKLFNMEYLVTLTRSLFVFVHNN